jgi:hypothetical protein
MPTDHQTLALARGFGAKMAEKAVDAKVFIGNLSLAF